MPGRIGSTRAALAALGLGGLVALGCNPFASAKLSSMTPGGNVATGQLECWLTMEFKRVPSGVDPKDVRVRFESVALQRPAEFGWDFIAAHDVIAQGGAFGSGYRQNAVTTPGAAPPLGQPIKVKFPLRARQRVETADTLWLHAELYWGGKKRASYKRSIEHVYKRDNMPL